MAFAARELMEPLLLDIPTELTTGRLRLRAPRAGDSSMIFPLVRQSLAELKPWMPWATDDYDLPACETWVRRAAGEFGPRKQLQFLIFAEADDGPQYVGTVGAHEFRWDVIEAEIGYWLGTPFVGRGYMTEAVAALAAMLTGPAVGASRLVVQADAANTRSRRVAERCGFTLEATFRHHRRNPAGQLADGCLYALVPQSGNEP